MLGYAVQPVAERSNRVNRLTTAPGVELFHDAMDMIFDGELGEMQVRGDFLVGHPARNQSHRSRWT